MSIATRFLTLSFFSICVSVASHASPIEHDESVDGDLSNDPANPTVVPFIPGRINHIVRGTVQASGDTRDYLTFTIARGQKMSRLNQLDYTDVLSGGGGDRGFHAIISGTSSFVPSGATIGNFLGSAHLDPLPPNTNMLPILASAPTGGTGFGPTLGPGTYTYLIQQTGTELTSYSVEFWIFPEPTSATLIGIAASLLVAIRRR